jgi:O-antigen/teichoic acid export membrane protein
VFGWPLLINGLVMYLIFLGDRVVIGASNRMFARASYTHADLAVYSLAFSLTLMPTMLVANVCSALFLPILSRVQGDRDRFEQHYRACTQIVCLVAACASVPLILAGDWLVVQIYGRGYSSAAAVIGWLAAMQAMRIIRVAPTLAAMALGDTKNSMVSNLVRTLAFVAVLAVAAAGGSLGWIAACGFGGEVLALASSLWGLRQKHGVAVKHCLEPCAVVALGLAMAAAAQGLGVPDLGGRISVLTSGLLVGVVCSVMLIAYPRLRHNLRSLVAW